VFEGGSDSLDEDRMHPEVRFLHHGIDLEFQPVDPTLCSSDVAEDGLDLLAREIEIGGLGLGKVLLEGLEVHFGPRS
jgi:hypothetical protein